MSSSLLLHLLLLLFSFFFFTSHSLDVEIDVSWDFNAGVLDGWANATTEELGIETRVEGGELRGSIIQWNPHFDSPPMFIKTTNRHYAVLRMMYFGGATKGQMLMKYGPSLPHSQNLDTLKSTWRNPVDLQVVAESEGGNGTGLYALDDSVYTTWETVSVRSGSWIIIDALDYRWITAIKIKSNGDEKSPKRCLLQQSVTSSAGPFVTVKDFTLALTSEDQTIVGFSKQSRYWKLIILNNYGGDSVAIRDIALEGYDEGVGILPFELDNSGTFKNYYLTIHDYLIGPLVQLRFEFFHDSKPEHLSRKSRPNFREAIAIDYVRIARAPEILQVRGCLDKYFDNSLQNFPNYNVEEKELVINGQLPIRYFTKQNYDSFRFASTYDCPHAGGIELRVDGVNLGTSPRVYIDDNECPVTYVGSDFETGSREGYVLCTLPPSSAFQAGGVINSEEVTASIVRVESATLPGLFENRPYFTYRKATPAPARPVITNIGARRVDIVWTPPGDVFDTMTTTAYKIIWFQPKFRTRVSNVTVGNVTTTSIRGLEPGTSYVFGVSALSEGGGENAAILPTDLYGRRDVKEGVIESPVSIFTNITATLANDFDFAWFDGNMTLNSSGASYSNSNGPTGLYGSEGNYGLTIVGAAHVENCNASMTCCDGYNETLGLASCGTGRTVCAVLLERRLAYEYVYDGISRRQVPSNRPYDDGSPPEKVILSLDELIAIQGAEMPSESCGPALRLTPSAARESGAIWYPRKMNVREGFETTISYQISNPSMRCNRLDDVNTYCRSRGADGLAFVLQDASPVALGLAGGGLGYEGINNSLAVEIDTFYNFDQMDYYENHVAVLTQGRSLNITANHSRSLATTTRVPDLTDARHTVRIKYDPNFDENAVLHPSFQTNGFTSFFLENGDFKYGGDGDWGTGFGLLFVYVDDMYSPIITTPLNLEKTLQLDEGRMYVGITAATGDAHWQVHDILGFQFSSLFIDQKYTPPQVVNGEGGKDCANYSVCTNFPDFDHYMRTNNIWGKGHDSTESYQSGNEGFCATC